MIKCIQIENACLDDEYVELDEFTIAEGRKIIDELGLEYADVEIKDNVMLIVHDDGVFVYVKQE